MRNYLALANGVKAIPHLLPNVDVVLNVLQGGILWKLLKKLPNFFP